MRVGGPESWCAYVDESESNRKLDPDVYILAAAIMDKEHRDSVRARMRPLLLPGQHKVHWYHESVKRRLLLAEVISSLDALHVVVVRTCRSGEPSERRRKKCMEHLLFQLMALGVDEVVLEARAPKQNRSDLHLLNVLRARGSCGAGLRIDHAPGPAEPLLWLPDAVAGAVVAARCGDGTYFEQIAQLLSICCVGP